MDAGIGYLRGKESAYKVGILYLTFPVKSGNMDTARVSVHRYIINKRRLMIIQQRENRTFRIALLIAIAVIER
ncbi:hypothetical protein CK510_16710 [Brunnivagina elsteri CCALA 953]|uniref:Uncharacterized protein n=1 Tax=Brunnivagina elsteri CCALA 953 TaxID=987040 RepID=A0A2A2TGR8_9CYAN|nr:hypothetical protein CK510_16710 [Calothrix elsteri CCALA 953]